MKNGILSGSCWGMYTTLIFFLGAAVVVYTVSSFKGESFGDSFEAYGLVPALAAMDVIIVVALSGAWTHAIR